MQGETSRAGLGAPLWVSDKKMVPQSPAVDLLPPVFTDLGESLYQSLLPCLLWNRNMRRISNHHTSRYQMKRQKK